MAYCRWFKQISKKDVPIAGGKGANLGEMFNSGFPVPPGFVISAEAYRAFLKEKKLDKKIQEKLENLDVENTELLQKAAKEVQDLILQYQMSHELKEEIQEFYQYLDTDEDLRNVKLAEQLLVNGRDLPFVAVRSSATAEDLPSISKDEYVLVKINNKTYFRKVEEIYDLVGDGSGFDIEIPAMQDNEIQWVKVGSLYKHKVKDREKLYKITTETGREIVVSPSHTLIVLDEDTLEPKNVKSICELKGNEKLPAINYLPVLDIPQKEIDILNYIDGEDIIEENGFLKIRNNSTNWKIQSEFPKKLKITKDLAYFLGIYCAEGSIYGKNEISVTNSDKDIMRRVISFISSLSLYKNQAINKNSLRFYNKTFLRFLNNVAGKPQLNIKGKGKICKTKQVPEFVFSWNKDLIGEFLKGCFDGDGYCGKTALEYCSTSKKLVSGIIKLLEMLNIGWYLRQKNNAYILCVSPRSFEKFLSLISFESKKKQKRLILLVNQFKEKKNHPEFLNGILISPKLSKYFRTKLEELLPKKRVVESFCPECNKKIEQSSSYHNKKRFYCRDCHKSFYEESIIKKEVEKYVYYNQKGKFTKNQIPWNKGFLSQKLGVTQLKNILSENNILPNTLNDSIKWDTIKEIKEIEYTGYVYDFCVPKVENFAAGVGGIITHNSASFAGQQATLLNIKGKDNVTNAVQKCWASLFTARAIYYRVKNNFPHMKVAIAVVIQKQINSEKSGVMFSINPATNDTKQVVIEAAWGLGEAVVSGEVNPNTYILEKESGKITEKDIPGQTWMFTRNEYTGDTVKKNIPSEKQKAQVLLPKEIDKLWEIALEVEKHYDFPQDMEWAIEKNKIYLVQTRPVTTIKPQEEKVHITGEPLLKGLGASPGHASGAVRIVLSMDKLDRVQKGDILVTKMTTPDFVPAMQRAVAIVTDEGGITAHAAIVSREMGIPCVVGTNRATHVLKDSDIITVDGSAGLVYRGKMAIEAPASAAAAPPPSAASTAVKVKVIMDLPEFAGRAAETGADGIGLLRLEGIIASGKIHPAKYLRDDKLDDYSNLIYEGVKKIATPFKDKPVWIRTSDIRTDEYRGLEGGDSEPVEANPMIGWHGIRRSLSQPELLKAEFRALKKLVDEGFTNLGVMIPFVISIDEIVKAKMLAEEAGLNPRKDIKFGVMVETPAAALIIEGICETGIDFISIGSNDLTQTILGVDRGNANIASLYTEFHPAVLKAIEHVIKISKKFGVESSICGQIGSDPKMAKLLVEAGIDSISANPDAVQQIRQVVAAQAE